MIIRVFFVIVFIALGALAYGWWYNQSDIKAHKEAKVQEFINAGPRFTAQDGQELCLLVKEIAKYSYGFQHSGKPLPECHYGIDEH